MQTDKQTTTGTEDKEVRRRTFEALKYPKGSKERERLNLDSLTSEYMTGTKYEGIIRHPQTETNNAYTTKRGFKTKTEAQFFIDNYKTN